MLCPPAKSCKWLPVRLCKKVDPALLRRERNPTDWAVFKNRHARINRAHDELEKSVPSWPNNDAEFLALILDWHGALFAGEPNIAQGFRRHDGIHFGGRAEYIKIPAQEIQERLKQVHRYATCGGVMTSLARAHVVRRAAALLEQYLFIHPFEDGNGRTARLAVRTFLRACGYDWNQSRTSGRDRRSYIGALHYAHVHNPRNGDRLCRPEVAKFYLWLLERWIETRINPFEQDPVEEAPEGFR